MSLVSSSCDAVGHDTLSFRFTSTQPSLAFGRKPGESNTCVVYLPGFRSSMTGRKGEFLSKYCQEMSLEYVCFDYRAFGESQGDWATDANISNWLADTLWILDHVVQSPKAILVGSSMGGWLALLAAQRRPALVHGLVLLAPAVDMTRYYPDPQQRRRLVLQEDGQGRLYYQVPNEYDEQMPYKVYEDFLRDGEQYCLLDEPAPIYLGNIPVRILHGEKDSDVPLERSLVLVDKLQSLVTVENLSLRVVKGGDHRLSDPEHLDILREILNQVVPTGDSENPVLYDS
eukprot:scaffold7349_cov173-Amphora_coffeaeformis.AAC.89